MATLLVLRGLPASGKTTEAKRFVEKGYVRVSRDDLRVMLFRGQDYSPESERIVKDVELWIVRLLLATRENVVIDDTNLKLEDVNKWVDLADRTMAVATVKEMETPVEECIRRDAERPERTVGEARIREMAAGYKPY